MGPLDEVIHQISIGCDKQFQRKVQRKIFISHQDSKILNQVGEQEVDMRKV